MMSDKIDFTASRNATEHGWVSRAYGLRVGVCSNDQTVIDQLGAFMPPGSVLDSSVDVDAVFSFLTQPPSNGGPPQFELYKDDLLLKSASKLDTMLEHFESAVGIFVAENALDRIFIHAGCVSWNGKAIIIPGRSYSGKTSLVAALLQAGATYYSDEYCVVDEHGLVHPYPRRLSLRAKEVRLRMTAEQFGSDVGTSGIPAGRLIYTKFEQNARWQPQGVTPGESVMLLLNNTVCARSKPDQALPALAKLAESAEGFRSARGEANECVAQILGIAP